MNTPPIQSTPRNTSLDAGQPYSAPGDATIVDTLPPSDPAAALINSGDVGSAIAAFVYLTSKEQRTNARNSRDAAYTAEALAQKDAIDEMRRGAAAKFDRDMMRGGMQLVSAGYSFAGVASPNDKDAFGVASKTVDAESALMAPFGDLEVDTAKRAETAANDRAENFKRIGDDYADDVRDAGKSIDKTLDFLKEFQSSRDASTSAAIHRA